MSDTHPLKEQPMPTITRKRNTDDHEFRRCGPVWGMLDSHREGRSEWFPKIVY
jgi:hypothetical protein